MFRRCLDILIMNLLKTTVYINNQTLKVLKKTRQLDNPVAEDYCRWKVWCIGMNCASYFYTLMDF